MILVIFCEFCSMPMLTESKVGKRGKLGIWHITESPDELLKMKIFSTEDRATLDSFSYEQRKKEWLVARILAEKLSEEKDIHIIYDEHSKPSLKGSKKYISLSHSHDLLAVILDEAETGIDIELIKPKIERIKEKFMSDPELKSLQREKQEEQLTVFWCAKESLYKLYGKKELEFKKHLLVEPFEYLEKGKIRADILHPSLKQKFVLHYEKISIYGKEYMMTYIINEG